MPRALSTLRDVTTTSEPPASAPRRWRRYGRLTPLASPLLLLVALAACGDDGNGGDAEAVRIQPTSYVMQPVAPPSSSASPDATLGSVPEGRNPGTQTYEIRGGDSLSAIAARYDIEMDAICSINKWTDCEQHVLLPGASITIPPGAAIPDDDEDEDDDSAAADDADDADAPDDAGEGDDADEVTGTGELCPDGSDRGTYTIEEGDVPFRVAERLDVTLEQLVEANAGNVAYRSFVVGSDIWLPCPGEGEEDAETEG